MKHNKKADSIKPSARDITFKLFCVNFLCHIESRPCFGPACVKCGVVAAEHHCSAFRYDPLKRVPPRPVKLHTGDLKQEDFDL